MVYLKPSALNIAEPAGALRWCCIIAAVGLTEVADLVAIHLIDWIAVR
jgi:hypothetical protein